MNNQNYISRVFVGIGLLLAGHVAAYAVISLGAQALYARDMASSADKLINSIFAVGWIQLIYVVPLCFLLGWRRRFALLQGVVIGAVLTALLNGGCFMLLFGILP